MQFCSLQFLWLRCIRPFYLIKLSFFHVSFQKIDIDVFPYIDARIHALKDLYFDNVLYKIFAEGLQLCEANNLKEAVLCFVASFFIFNINYPKSCFKTLTVFEKLFLNGNDTLDIDDTTVQWIKFFRLRAGDI